MIPESYIEAWRQNAQWQTLAMIEQDLVISRVLICLYNNDKVRDSLVFRGGTALNKLYLKPPARYSEDIDFVQKKAEPIGETINAIRDCLNDWFGEPKRKITERGAKLVYQYTAINGLPAKLKIEINTTEHFQVLPLRQEQLLVNSEWFQGECGIVTYAIEELMATKLRALYQRRKGKDLFDVWHVFSKDLANLDVMIDVFNKYCKNDEIIISKELFKINLEAKRLNKDFSIDMNVLLPHKIDWAFDEAFEYVQNHIIRRIS